MEQVSPKIVFPIKNGKSENHHWILYIRISLSTKLQFKLAILKFWTKFAQKRFFLVGDGKIALARASVVVTYYIKLFYMEADRHNGIFILIFLLVAETKIICFYSDVFKDNLNTWNSDFFKELRYWCFLLIVLLSFSAPLNYGNYVLSSNSPKLYYLWK